LRAYPFDGFRCHLHFPRSVVPIRQSTLVRRHTRSHSRSAGTLALYREDVMSVNSLPQTQQYDVATIMGGLYGDGIIGLKGAFDRDWVATMHTEILRLYEEALKRPGGAVGRGPKRH